MNDQLKYGFGVWLLLVSCLASAQEAPSFDCAKAKTQVEKVLCSGGNSGMGWIDQTMANLYQAIRKVPDTDLAALESSQRAWLAKRN